MELRELEGNIIGIISDKWPEKQNFGQKIVKEIINHRLDDSLKMVNLPSDIQDKSFDELSTMEQNKVILASKLNDKEIVLVDFSKGLLKKEVGLFKRLFKKISTYGKKIYLYSNDAEMFINCVDMLYVINKDEVIYSTDDIFDPTLYMEIDYPRIVEFIYECQDLGIHLDEYTDINELIKAIYRIKS